MCFLPFQEIVETTTVPEITTVAEIIEEGDSDGDDSVRFVWLFLFWYLRFFRILVTLVA